MAVTTSERTSARSEAHAITALDLGLLFLRIGLGAVFIAHGSQKVLGWFGGPGLTGTVGFMGHMGIPAPLAYLAAFTELLGGIAVLLGVFTRLAAIGLSVVMLTAIVTVHLPHGFFADKQGFEYPFALLMIALALVLSGPGRLGIGDWEPALIGRRASRPDGL